MRLSPVRRPTELSFRDATSRAPLKVNVLSLAAQVVHPHRGATLGSDRSCRPLPVRLWSASAGAGDRLPSPPEPEQHLEPRDAAADDAQLHLDRGPDPQVEAVPCDIVGFFQDIIAPVDADAAGDDDDQTEAEERDEGEPLRQWE